MDAPHIPLDEAPGAANQRDYPEHDFMLLTNQQIYPRDGEQVRALEALGFGFHPSCNPHYSDKTKNREATFRVHTLGQLMQMVERFGPMLVAKDTLVIMSDWELVRTEAVEPFHGVSASSLNQVNEKP